MVNNNAVLNQKNHLIIKLWTITIFLFLFIMLLVCIFYKYKIYDKYQGFIIQKTSGYYLNLYLTDEQINDFNFQQIYIDNNRIDKQIIDISDDYILNNNGSFRLLTLDLNQSGISSKYLINNNVVTIRVYKRNTTIMKEIINEVLKGGT